MTVRTSEVEALLAEAFERRRLIAFDYDSLPREVVPGAYGTHVTTRNLVLRGYQVGGRSKTGSVPFWKLFLLDKITNLAISAVSIGEVPPQFNPVGDEHISPIILKLEPE